MRRLGELEHRRGAKGAVDGKVARLEGADGLLRETRNRIADAVEESGRGGGSDGAEARERGRGVPGGTVEKRQRRVRRRRQPPTTV